VIRHHGQELKFFTALLACKISNHIVYGIQHSGVKVVLIEAHDEIGAFQDVTNFRSCFDCLYSVSYYNYTLKVLCRLIVAKIKIINDARTYGRTTQLGAGKGWV